MSLRCLQVVGGLTVVTGCATLERNNVTEATSVFRRAPAPQNVTGNTLMGTRRGTLGGHLLPENPDPCVYTVRGAARIFRMVSKCPQCILWFCHKTQTVRKANHSSFLTSIVVGGRRPFRLKFALKVTHQKRRLRQISPYNISTVRDSEKVQ